jgi:hypothetical protein
MTMLSFQHSAQQNYLGKSMNPSLDIPGAGGYSDPAAEMAQSRKPISHSAATASSFGVGSSWLSTHVNPHGSYQRGLMKTVADFDTSRVDPTVR